MAAGISHAACLRLSAAAPPKTRQAASVTFEWLDPAAERGQKNLRRLQGRRCLQISQAILLDTHAVIWILSGHRRVLGLMASGQPLLLSPVSILEIRFLTEAGKVRIADSDWAVRMRHDRRFRFDDCRVGELVEAAAALPPSEPAPASAAALGTASGAISDAAGF